MALWPTPKGPASLRSHAMTSARMQFLNSMSDLQAMIDGIPYPVVVKSRTHRIVLLNTYACTFLGADRDIIISRADHDMHPADDVLTSHAADDLVFATGFIDERVASLTDGLGLIRQVSARRQRVVLNGSDYLVLVMSEVSELQAAACSPHPTARDTLAGLSNQSFLQSRIEHISPEKLNRCALLLIDLDHVKAVDDHDHAIGEEVLIQFGQRLSGIVRACDTVVHFDGNVFSILLTDIDEDSSIEHICRRIAMAGLLPFTTSSGRLMMTASIGAVPLQAAPVAVSELYRRGDAALHQAKDSGRGRWCVHTDGLDQQLRHRQLFEADLSDALAEGSGIDIHYQPLVAMASGEVIGFEALARWNHPIRGLVMPNDFIPVAEASGLIIRLGEIILRKACTDAADWSPPLRVSVNVSPTQFANDNLVSLTKSALDASGLDPSRLDLEVTEGVLIGDADAARAVLTRLRALGVKIALDDFGTGFSSLSYLRRLPFDRVKIDKSFITDITTDSDAMSIVEAVLGLCRSLNITAVAEGVETADQFEILRGLGCPHAQGYLIGRPLPIDSFVGLILEDPEGKRLRAH